MLTSGCCDVYVVVYARVTTSSRYTHNQEEKDKNENIHSRESEEEPKLARSATHLTRLAVGGGGWVDVRDLERMLAAG